MRFNSKKKKGYPKSGSRFIDKAKDIGTSRGAKQTAAGVAIVTDLATGANISRLPFQGLVKAGTKLAEGAGHLRRGAGALKNTLASAYQKSRKGSTPSKPSSSKPLQITAGGPKPLEIAASSSKGGVIIPDAPKPHPSGAATHTAGQNTKATMGGKFFRGSKVNVPNNPLNTTGLSKGPGSKAGSFSLPKSGTILDSRINSTTSSAKNRASALIKEGQKTQKSLGPSAANELRSNVATKVKDIRSRARNKVTKLAETISKSTGKSVNYIKAANKKLSTPEGRKALDTAYKNVSKRSSVLKPGVKLLGGRVAGLAIIGKSIPGVSHALVGSDVVGLKLSSVGDIAKGSLKAKVGGGYGDLAKATSKAGSQISDTWKSRGAAAKKYVTKTMPANRAATKIKVAKLKKNPKKKY